MDTKLELLACAEDPFYFVDRYSQVYDATSNGWLPFRLWPAQRATLDTIHGHQLTVALKARQLGFSWLVLGYALWQMLFRPAATVLLFSKRDEEAIELLDFRLKEMHARLPAWARAKSGKTDGKHDWILRSGSRAKAFPTTGGRSYTGSLLIVDEADFVPDLNTLLNAVKPTIDAGGKLILVSTVDKSRPQSTFKRIYRAAKAGENGYAAVFHGWRARPERTPAWYEAQRADVLARTGSLDDLHQEYPDTDAEALAPRSLDKRIAPAWLQQCYVERKPIVPWPQMEWPPPAVPRLEVYLPRVPGRKYVVGADPAEGNPNSDESAATVLDAETWEEVASLAGLFEPSVFAAHLDAVGRYYNDAPVLVERNNHGHAVLLWLRDNSKLRRLAGLDSQPGWQQTTKSKAMLYDGAADAFREEDTLLHSFATFTQLASVEGATLKAPEGERDDRAVGYALALAAARRVKNRTDFAPYVAGRL